MKINPAVFREYDIRGVVDQDLSPDFARALGAAYGTMLLQEHPITSAPTLSRTVSVGHDCRLSSPAYAEALAEGISSTGISVQMLGMGPTPQVYFSIYERQLDGGIQVTGSHNPSDMNGFKICIGKSTLSGEAIQRLFRLMNEHKEAIISPRKELISECSILDTYKNYLVENIRPHMGTRKLKVVVDAGNGVGGMVGPDMLRQLGVEVVELYCEPDGSFPNHHPDPTVMENIVDLREAVLRHKADCGVGWDGDGDRIGLVDEKGEVIFGDMLLLIYGRELLKEKSTPPTVIGDVKCSSRLFQTLADSGARAIMWKTGHSLIKKKLYEENADLAGEMSGHIFFKHRFFGFDDALYATGRLIEILSKHKGDLSSLLSDIPKYSATPEIRIDCPDNLKFRVPELAKDFFKDYRLSLIDGVRVEFERGWGLVRASNTQPALVMRFEAETDELLNRYQGILSEGIAQILSTLTNDRDLTNNKGSVTQR